MPTYEYECRSCGYIFEEFQKMTDPPIDKCPKCGKQLRRLIGTGSGIIFRGSGFYATDYRSKDYKEKSRQESKQTCPASPKTGCESCEKIKRNK